MVLNDFRNKTVLITGNSGFKGSWLTIWLTLLGARVHGISKDIPTSPSMFEVLQLKNRINHQFSDLSKESDLTDKIARIDPDFVFHLAAQALVKSSYENPAETIRNNVMSTTYLLDAIRLSGISTTAVFVTSDKCYHNLELETGYKETDRLGGKDIYSASKSSCEMVIQGYYHSFFKGKNAQVNLCSVRAGNIIGGGDWAENRLISDCVTSWSQNQPVVIRSPYAVRPWQHVLEPLNGYLNLAQKLQSNPGLSGNAFNFGPTKDHIYTVKQLLTEFSDLWKETDGFAEINFDGEANFHEATLLMLDCEKATSQLEWHPVLSLSQTLRFTTQWYQAFLKNSPNLFELTVSQIEDFVKIASLTSKVPFV